MPSKNLSVFLNDRFVGVLTQLVDGRTFLAFGNSYLSDSNRPTLSLSYKNVLNDLQTNAQTTSVGLPPFFSHLLPEGLLRKYLARKTNVKETQEFRLLSALKDDLPGAVRLSDSEVSEQRLHANLDEQGNKTSVDQPLRFSLAGVQMKLSGDLKNSRIVIPARGIGGHWIIKLPSPIHAHIVGLEYSMLMLASKIGITVPEFRLIPTRQIENLPNDLPATIEGDCLISRRFDRAEGGDRIHMEDFAQVFAVLDKYDARYNYQSIANVLQIEIGLDAVLEFVRRLVHMFVFGNADMHLKNWSLVYADGRQPRLAPAYDLVSTVVYSDIETNLPHKMAGEMHFGRISIDTFKKFAQIAKLPERPVVNTVIQTVDAIKDWWPRLRSDLPIPDSYKERIEKHMKEVPVIYQRLAPMPVRKPTPIGTTWPVWDFYYEIELDESVPADTIVYKNQSGKRLEMEAPRHMGDTFIQTQLHEVLRKYPEFANQTIEGRVGLNLYDEWRKNKFLRIQNSLIQGGLDKNRLEQSELRIRVELLLVDWRNLEQHYKAKEQPLTLDFELADGQLWTCDCTLASLKSIELQPLGTRVADICLYIQNRKHVFDLPQSRRTVIGSTSFSVSPTFLADLDTPDLGGQN